MEDVTDRKLLAAHVLELSNEAAFLAASIGDGNLPALASSVAIAAGEILGLTTAQVMRMQSEQSGERTRILPADAKRLRNHVARLGLVHCAERIKAAPTK